MKICPNCKTENKFDGAQFCKKCGSPLVNSGELEAAINNSEIDNDFEVTEASDTPSPELFSAEKKKSADNKA